MGVSCFFSSTPAAHRMAWELVPPSLLHLCRAAATPTLPAGKQLLPHRWV